MDIRHLRSFVTVAENLHFSRSAEQLGLSPPTLTAQIQEVERLLQARHHCEAGAMIGGHEIGGEGEQLGDGGRLLFGADRAQVRAADPAAQAGCAGNHHTITHSVDKTGMGTAADYHQPLAISVIENSIVSDGVPALTACRRAGNESGIACFICCCPGKLATEPKSGRNFSRLGTQMPIGSSK